MEGEGSSSKMFLAGLIANLPGLSAGLSMGFSAILIPQLQEPGAEITATLEQGSWIASLFVIGDLLGCVIGGPLADRYGRRLAILLDCLPLIAGWLLTWQAQSLDHLYIARAITGVGIGAGVPIASMYLREISTPELRGTLTILMPAAANTGNLLMYILGSLLPWRLTTLPGAMIPLLPIVLVYFLPETPVWLLARGRREEAEKNLCSLRGLTSSQVHEELKALEVGEEEQKGQSRSIKTTVSKLLDRSVLLPMALLVFLFFTQSFSGSNMVSYYTVTILQMANIPLDENLAAILVASQYVVGYCLSSVFVTRVSRRALLFGSLTLMMIANLGAGIVLFNRELPTGSTVSNKTEHLSIIEADQFVSLTDIEQLPVPGMLDQAVSMVPVISCIFITFGYACGLGPVPFILFGELFPSSVRGSATSITAFLRSITVFLSIKIFPSLLWFCDIWGSFLTCALVCFLAIGVSFFTVPETKGMNSKQLESIYKKQEQDFVEGEVSQGLMSGDSNSSAC